MHSLWRLALIGALWTVHTAAMAAPPASDPAQPARALSAASCAALAKLPIAHAQILTAELVSAGAFHPPSAEPFGAPPDFTKLPPFCRIAGSLHPTADSDIRFELWLPAESWNGRFLQAGNGGAAGALVYSALIDPLARGYAVAHTDTGHQGALGSFDWAAGHPERVTDYAYRAVHELTLTAKAIVARAYGTQPAKSLWMGCSTGGRQGLMEARRYPADYDAIIAGAPANNLVPLLGLSVLINKELLARDGLRVDKLSLLKEAAIKACDANDGVIDRVIGDPRRCDFDPKVLSCTQAPSAQCLNDTELAAAQRIYSGLVTKDGRVLIPGTGVAGEPAWAALASPFFDIGTSFFRYVIKHDPDWQAASFDVDRDMAQASAVDGGTLTEMTGDLGPFFARGGKLLTYHGTTDGLIPYRNTENYYHRLVERVGQRRVSEQVRLYLVPGMDHCFGGEGAFAVDWLSALESWVDHGQAPAALPASHYALPTPGSRETPLTTRPFTRPVCPYPAVARYSGSGDETLAASYACTDP